MPQPKSSRTPKSTARKAGKTTGEKARAKSSAGKAPAKSTAAKAPAKSTAKKSAKRSSAAKPDFAARRSAQPDGGPIPGTDAARDEALKANLGALRELLAGGVVLTAQRIQESLDEAVERGRMTRRDAEELARGLLDAGRRQSADLLSDVEQLLGRSREELTAASTRVRDQATQRGDRVLREVDRVRRGAGVGPSFPILDFPDLKAAQVRDRLDDLTPAQLRKVRDFERRNRNRSSVLSAIERKLG